MFAFFFQNRLQYSTVLCQQASEILRQGLPRLLQDTFFQNIRRVLELERVLAPSYG